MYCFPYSQIIAITLISQNALCIYWSVIMKDFRFLLNNMGDEYNFSAILYSPIDISFPKFV